jgi:hypothetical protein
MAALLNVHTVKIGTHVEPEGGGSPRPQKQLIPIYSLDDKFSESFRFSASCSNNIISFSQPGQARPPETKTHMPTL